MNRNMDIPAQCVDTSVWIFLCGVRQSCEREYSIVCVFAARAREPDPTIFTLPLTHQAHRHIFVCISMVMKERRNLRLQKGNMATAFIKIS